MNTKFLLSILSIVFFVTNVQAADDFAETLAREILTKGTISFNNNILPVYGEGSESNSQTMRVNLNFTADSKLDSQENTISGKLQIILGTHEYNLILSNCGTNEILSGLNEFICSTDRKTKLVLSVSENYRKLRITRLEEKTFENKSLRSPFNLFSSLTSH